MTNSKYETYDPFNGPELDHDLWQEFVMAGETIVEPEATTEVRDGVLTLDVPKFTRASDQGQGFDNLKHVVLTTRSMPVAASGVSRFAVDLAVDHIGGDTGDYRLGAASFHVFDAAGSLVFNHMATADRIVAEHEVLGGDQPFTRVIDSPFIQISPDGFRSLEVELDPAAGRATWLADGQVVHEAFGIPAFPDSVRLGYSFVTLVPIGSGRGSNHGHGGRASWRNFRYDIAGSVE